ncbi:MAG: hypothetical protein KC777_03800 [Cyanobacteria bacterium HKST-UBA02]|nr:hypothetical protein [Cyanobacteria bacterium HKST-UBA02]
MLAADPAITGSINKIRQISQTKQPDDTISKNSQQKQSAKTISGKTGVDNVKQPVSCHEFRLVSRSRD